MTYSSAKPARDQQPLQTTTWTVAMVRRALQDLERGQYQRAAQLADAMTRDDRISGTLRTRVRGLLGLPRTFMPASETREPRRIALALEQDFELIAPDSVIAELMRWALLGGVAIAEHIWTRDPSSDGSSSRWIPTLKVWHPQFQYYRWDTRSWWLNTMDGPLEVKSGDGHWVTMSMGAERPWMEGLIRELAIPFLIRQFAMRDWARYSEVHGLPTKRASVPSSSSEDDRKLFFNSIRNLGSEAIIKMVQPPEGEKPFTFDLLEATASTWAGFQGLIQQMDSSIAISILGQNLTTEVKGGSRSAAQVHDRVRLDVLEADANALQQTLERQSIHYWHAVNYGGDAVKTVPGFVLEVEPPSDQKLAADTLNVVADLLPKLRAAGVNIQPILDEYNLELDATLPTPTPSPAPAPAPEQTPELMTAQGVLDLLMGKTGKTGTLASGDPSSVAPGMVAGQGFADQLVPLAKDAARDSVQPMLSRIVLALETADTLEDAREELLSAYSDLDETSLARVLEAAGMLSNLAGRLGALEDAKSKSA